MGCVDVRFNEAETVTDHTHMRTPTHTIKNKTFSKLVVMGPAQIYQFCSESKELSSHFV